MVPRDGDQPAPDSLTVVDRLVGVLVLGVLLLGGYSWWRAMQATARRRGMMGSMGMMPAMDPLWYLLGTLLVVGVILSGYLLTRDQIARVLTASNATATQGEQIDATTSDPHDQQSAVTTDSPTNGGREDEAVSTRVTRDTHDPLAVLPEDERRVLQPVVESPGLTQVELRGRADFSKAKVSQTVSDLEDRGLVYRERQGRTFRVYPGELVKDHEQS